MENTGAVIHRNTLTNYVATVIRIIQGILLTRWLFLYLGQAYYGFWGLLWTSFVYILVFNFGFNSAAQKCTAEKLYETDIKYYNDVIAAVFSLQWLMSLVIIGCTVLAAVYLRRLTNIDISTPEGAAQLAYCRLVLLIFGIGIALTFPTGMIPDILVGLKMIYLRNYVLIGGRLVELFGIYMILKLGGSLLALTLFVLPLNFSLNFVMYLMIRRCVPGFRLAIRPNFGILKKLANFSLFVYLFSIASLVCRKTDRVVLSVFIGLEATGIYQIGTRLSDLLDNLSSQFQDNVAPMTAGLLKSGEKEKLNRIIIAGLRFTAWQAAGGCAVLIVLAPEIMMFLFKNHNGLSVAVCRVMLVSVFFSVSFRNFLNRIMLMSGNHKLLCVLTWSDAVLNLGLSIFLIFRMGVLGVVWGTLIPNVLLSLFVAIPFYAKFLDSSVFALLKRVYLGSVASGFGAAAAVWYARELLTPWDWPIFVQVVVFGGIGGAAFFALSAFWSVSAGERKKLWHMGMGKILKPRRIQA